MGIDELILGESIKDIEQIEQRRELRTANLRGQPEEEFVSKDRWKGQ